jgi:NAD(P)H-quinone oxidoreductase subunit 5
MKQNWTVFTKLFYLDALSIVIMGLVAFIAICIGSYSLRYLEGDKKKRTFFLNLSMLVCTVFILLCADHLLLFLASWGVSNYLLAKLMLHKRGWEAARQSSILAGKNFGLGLLFLSAAALILYNATGLATIQGILSTPLEPWAAIASGILLLLAAMTQSALWPFHRWLTSSLNSPTPVSALMHAGLVNGGGLLLARFSPILAQQPVLMNMIFATGITTALLGTLWKLMQSDIKRMLASSTMGQMGFMIAQCGLGLFPAAVAHLCWHGLFKAYLFLTSASAAREQRLDLDYPPSTKHFLLSLICGAFGAYTFSLGSAKAIATADTTLFLTLLAMIAGAQFALPIISSRQQARLPLALLATAIMGICYGFSVYLIEHLLAPINMLVPQPLNALHFIAAALLIITWLAMLFVRPIKSGSIPDWLLKKYVQMLNASQPHPETINAHRNKYQY